MIKLSKVLIISRNILPESGEKGLYTREELMEIVSERVKKCTACPLHLNRTNVVVGEGNLDTRIVLWEKDRERKKTRREDLSSEERECF